MNKPVKYILLGIGSCIGVFLVMILLRNLIHGSSFAEEAKDWTNWLVAVCCGISTAWSTLKRDKDKENKSKEENK